MIEMVERGAHSSAFRLIGGCLCLDFANTAGSHASEHPSESLESYADLVAWSRQAGILSDDEAQHLLREAQRRPAEAAAVLDQARALREVIYHVFSAVAAGRAPAAADLGALNAALSVALARLCVAPTGDGFAWTWTGDANVLDRMLWPIARSAADLLTSETLPRVRECAAHPCGWLFVDMSRNHSRRWCDMQDCGNRAKARRHYQRKRAASSPHFSAATSDE